jgi:ankyrin repeat protein
MDGFGRTALHYASTGPFVPTVGFLLKKGPIRMWLIAKNTLHPSCLPSLKAVLTSEGYFLNTMQILHWKIPMGDTSETFARQNGHSEVADLLKPETIQ